MPSRQCFAILLSRSMVGNRMRIGLSFFMPLARACMAALGLAAFSDVASAQPSCPRADLTQIEPRASAATRPVRNGDETIFVRQNAITTANDISEIKVERDDFETSILIKYNPEAAARLLAVTTNNEGVQLAFVVDDDVLLSFTWEGTYGIGPSGVQMSILNGPARAQKLVESLRGCTDDDAA